MWEGGHCMKSPAVCGHGRGRSIRRNGDGGEGGAGGNSSRWWQAGLGSSGRRLGSGSGEEGLPGHREVARLEGRCSSTPHFNTYEQKTHANAVASTIGMPPPRPTRPHLSG